MVVIILPEWYGKAREDLERAIWDIAVKNNIDYLFVRDSQTVKESINSIMDVFLRISNKVKSDYKYIDDSRKTKTKSKTGGKKND